ncbi:RING finger protein 223-like [Dendropsophus ebraccatus]|uniref:RING finger protein 223-like n=1 Tax=Dendropsophus ebraccatus TaxID=150705 RepID=UPI003831F7CF
METPQLSRIAGRPHGRSSLTRFQVFLVLRCHQDICNAIQTSCSEDSPPLGHFLKLTVKQDPGVTDMEQEYPVPECPVCFTSYDNVFKTPLLLPCSHTFCMECLSKLCIFLKDQETFRCPVCRTTVSIPPGGVPQLPPNMDIVSRFPPWMRQLEMVWMEGSKLCWRKRNGQNFTRRTQTPVSHVPPRQEENMVISIYLLSPAVSRTTNLVVAPQQPIHHPRFSRNCGRISCLFFTALLFFLFAFIFFPMMRH